MLNQRKLRILSSSVNMKSLNELDNREGLNKTTLELREYIESLQKLLEVSRIREKRLVSTLEGIK